MPIWVIFLNSVTYIIYGPTLSEDAGRSTQLMYWSAIPTAPYNYKQGRPEKLRGPGQRVEVGPVMP